MSCGLGWYRAVVWTTRAALALTLAGAVVFTAVAILWEPAFILPAAGLWAGFAFGVPVTRNIGRAFREASKAVTRLQEIQDEGEWLQ